MVLKKRFILIVSLTSLLFVLFSLLTLALCTSNCPDGTGCFDSTFCLSGNCVNGICCAAGKTCCSSSYGSQCPSGYFCGSQYYCVIKKASGASCTSDYECQPGYCTNNVCCDAITTCCTSSSQCGTDMVCSSGVCKWACETKTGGCCFSDSDCPSGYKCNKYSSTEFQWGECSYTGGTTPSTYCGDGRCNSGETCSSCSQDCGTCQVSAYCGDGSCNGGETCSSCSSDCGTCQTEYKKCYNSQNQPVLCCDSDSDCHIQCIECKSGYKRCDISKGYCIECNSDSDCKSGYECRVDYDNSCVTKTVVSKKSSGQPCSSDSECGSGLWCNWLEPGKLYDGKTGVCCKTGKGCCDSPYVVYNMASGKVGNCETDFTVTVWEDKATGKKANGQSCSSNSECESGWCNNKYCCEYGKNCCTMDSECESGFCWHSEGWTGNYWCKELTSENCGDGTCQSNEDCGSCEVDCGCSTEECCISKEMQFGGGGYYTDKPKRCAVHGDIVRTHEDSGERNFCVNGKITNEAWGTCVFDSHCKNNYRIRKHLSDKYGRTVEDSEIVCVVQKENYGVCDKKAETIPIKGIVTSIEPVNDPEAEEIKKLIEEEIYPAIVEIFDENSNKVFTGPRDYDPNIKLRMTDKETVAMWDESTNVMTIPYRNMYENFGSFSPKNMQLNGIAHELTHYHFNGFALKESGDFKKIPLWFREGIAEYGAHKYYKKYLQSEVPPWSVSESRSNIFINYLATNPKLYKETVQKDAIDKVAWKREGTWDKNINQYSHVYYGAVFDFINYFLSTYKEDESMMDIMKYIFIMGSKEKFKFYTSVGSEGVVITEYNIKKDWFNNLDANHKIKENLDNKPPNIVKRFFTGVGDFFRNLFSG